MRTITEARRALALSQLDLAKITQINQALISQFERGLRSPTPIQSQRLRSALGQIDFTETEDLKMLTNVPHVPDARWKNGKPDFSHLDDDKGSVKDQLAILIVKNNGDGSSLKQITTDYCYFEVLDEDGDSSVYKQKYIVTNGGASLHGDPIEAGKEFELLDRRRRVRCEVPDPNKPDEE